MNEEFPIGYVRALLNDFLPALKDEDYQRRVWFRHEGPEIDCYLDTTVYFMEKCEILLRNPSTEKCLGKENYALVEKLFKLVREHVRSTEDRINAEELKEDELLDDPKWHDIQTLARELEFRLIDFLKRFNNE